MKKYWKVIGIAALVAGIIYYPALKLYQYIKGEKAEQDGDEEVTRVKLFSPAYRGKHLPHHRHSHNNGNGKLA